MYNENEKVYMHFVDGATGDDVLFLLPPAANPRKKRNCANLSSSKLNCSIKE